MTHIITIFFDFANCKISFRSLLLFYLTPGRGWCKIRFPSWLIPKVFDYNGTLCNICLRQLLKPGVLPLCWICRAVTWARILWMMSELFGKYGFNLYSTSNQLNSLQYNLRVLSKVESTFKSALGSVAFLDLIDLIYQLGNVFLSFNEIKGHLEISVFTFIITHHNNYSTRGKYCHPNFYTWYFWWKLFLRTCTIGKKKVRKLNVRNT